MALLAHCVSYGVNALYERPNPYSGSGVSEHALKLRFAQADRLARATGLDMVQVGGGRRSAIISAGSPSPASSKPCAKAPVNARRNSSTT